MPIYLLRLLISMHPAPNTPFFRLSRQCGILLPEVVESHEGIRLSHRYLSVLMNKEQVEKPNCCLPLLHANTGPLLPGY